MKVLQTTITFLILSAILSCNPKVAPIENGLEGSWHLLQSTFFNGQDTFTKDHASTPELTATFSATGELVTIAIGDSVLDQARYFKAGYNSLVGPVLDLYKVDGQQLVLLKYIADRDTLIIHPFIGGAFSYKFRRR